MLVSNPIGLTWEEWQAALISDNGLALGWTPEEQWKDWAASLRDSIGASDSQIPEPYQFEKWNLWVEAALLGLEQS